MNSVCHTLKALGWRDCSGGKALALSSRDLSLALRTHSQRGKSTPTRCFLSSTDVLWHVCILWYPTYTHTKINKCKKKSLRYSSFARYLEQLKILEMQSRIVVGSINKTIMQSLCLMGADFHAREMRVFYRKIMELIHTMWVCLINIRHVLKMLKMKHN